VPRPKAKKNQSKGVLDLAKVDSDIEYRAEAQHRCLTDHFFLAETLGRNFNGFIPRIHQPVVDLYFPKNRGLSIPDQHKIKNRLHLDPRTTGKTTMGRVDLIQWMLAFPEDISILTETATKPLAEAISRSMAELFWKPKDILASPLQRVFPEMIVEKRPTGIWDTPLRMLGSLDNTLNFTSPRATQSGWHPWITNVDDICETENSGIHATEDVRQSVIDTYYTNKNTLLPGGYNYLKGTRYHPFELYGDVLDKLDPEQWKVLIRAAMIVRSAKKLLPGEFPAEDDVILNFPEMPGMDYKSLRQKFYDDYESFMCQQQNDPQGGHIPTFDEDLYASMLIAPERIPPLGETYVCWRLPYGGKDYMTGIAEGAAARVWEGKVYIIDAWSGKYTPSRLAEKIVKECREHQSQYLLMEDLPGVQYMEGSIRNELNRRNTSVRIQWLEFEEDDNMRGERIKTLEPQARAGKILLSTACGKAGELKRQLVNFGLVRENGIVDCISRLGAKVPVSLMRQEIEDEEMEAQRRRNEMMASHFVHGYGQVEGLAEAEKQKRERDAAQLAMESSLNIGLTDILGGLDG
jgi:hypothetical protein